MASVSLVLRKDKINSKSKAPIHIRITKNRKSSYFTTGVSLDPQYWDESKGKVKTKFTNSVMLNNLLHKKLQEIETTVWETESYNKDYSREELKNQINGKEIPGFFEYAYSLNERERNQRAVGTYSKNKSILKKLLDYSGNQRLDFKDINYNFLINYTNYLSKSCKNAMNTIHKDYRYLKRIFNEAIREGIITYEMNPFNKYKIQIERTEKTYLTANELAAIEILDLTDEPKLEFARDLFVFVCVCGGLRISDVISLNKENFDGTHIHFKTQKTKHQVSIKVPEKAKKIIHKYIKNEFVALFPIVKFGIDFKSDAELADRTITSATTVINRNLKIVAMRAKINKNLSTRVGRHTFATQAISKGIPIEFVSSLMTHNSIRTTQIYTKILKPDLDNAMDKFNQ
jgi:integrase/recombinase XerD